MGCADIIPGVSGGTVALILGIYERLIESIRLMDAALVMAAFSPRFWALYCKGLVGDFAPGDDAVERRAEAALFLTFLVVGILAAIVAAAGVIKHCMAVYPEQTRGLFMGLVLASMLVPFRRMEKRGAAQWVAFLLFAVGLYLLLGLGRADVEPALWYVFICGAIAISAMILPGISGAFILLMLGLYFHVLDKVHALTRDRDFSAVLPLVVLVLGIVVGIVAFSRLLNYLLKNHHDLTMASLVGLLAGSLRVLWPFKEGVAGEGGRVEFMANKLPELSHPGLWGTVATFVAGIVVVAGLDLVGRKYGED